MNYVITILLWKMHYSQRITIRDSYNPSNVTGHHYLYHRIIPPYHIDVVCFNVIFKNISVLSWQSVWTFIGERNWCTQRVNDICLTPNKQCSFDYTEKTTAMVQLTFKHFHIKLYWIPLIHPQNLSNLSPFNLLDPFL